MNQTAKNGELIKVPNTLKNKIGGRIGKVNHAAIAKAEAALASLSSNFEEWVADEVTKLEEARRKVSEGGLSGESGKELFGVSHDLKGLGTTYGYPLITQIADSLCSIIHTPELREQAPLRLIDAHVDAVRAAIRGKIKDVNHPVGSMLSSELRKKTQEFLGKI
ncbi:MAG: Hpt domain-containing protein [Robiginitomaculum sp.]|nr:MAG: Hpt domain-containing protein [Robiginitomaculum sp.]